MPCYGQASGNQNQSSLRWNLEKSFCPPLSNSILHTPTHSYFLLLSDAGQELDGKWMANFIGNLKKKPSFPLWEKNANGQANRYRDTHTVTRVH